MSDLYTLLQVSPRKKKCPPEFDNETTLTPKKLRTAPPTPPLTKYNKIGEPVKPSLPTSLTRLYNLQTALQHALSHALATCAISPTSDSGIVKNVLNHISVVTYSGFSTTFEAEDLKRLCWLWEWDGKSLPREPKVENDDDNPFLESKPSLEPPPSDWTRGSMGFIISSATHYAKTERKRIPAYGIGVEVEIDIDKDTGTGMAAVARWTSLSEARRSEFKAKLEHWIELHKALDNVPPIPLANIPDISAPKVSALTRTLASCSPSAISPSLMPTAPSSPSRSPIKKERRDLSSIPFPMLTSKSPSKKAGLLFPQTPSRHERNATLPPQTPSERGSPSKDWDPSTPVHQRPSEGSSSRTPSTSRRDALLERVRQRSLSASPTKSPQKIAAAAAARFGGSGMNRDQILKLSQDAMRRRCLLGRLGGVAESIWMLFLNSAPTPSRKRRVLPLSDVIAPVIKSSPVPISASEANESINMLVNLCPFFLKKIEISGSDWLEMPAPSNSSNTEASLSKSRLEPPGSPGRLKVKDDSAQQLLTRSPRRVNKEGGTLREVREIIRRELELDD